MIYLDTSFLVSLYSVDANSVSAVQALHGSSESFLVTTLTELEAVNALGLRVFRNQISQKQADASLRVFEEHLRREAFLRRSMPESAFERALKLSRQTTAQLGTRTADLLHVAVALELGATGFVTFDLRQSKLAQSEGLSVNPMP